MPDLVVDEQGFSLSSAGKVLERCSWGDIESIVAFKRDYGTYDEICLQIGIGRRPAPLEVNEEFGRYEQFTEMMEKRLPAVCQGWWRKVAFPAFETNPTVVFSRAEAGEGGTANRGNL